MRFPNLRYGNPTEFAYYAMGRTLPELARQLRRDERTIRDWLSGRAKVPWWVPEIMRLKKFEADVQYKQMFWAVLDKAPVTRLGVVADDGALQLIDTQKETPQVIDLGRSQELAPAAVGAGSTHR